MLAAEAEAARTTGYADLGQALTRPRVLVLGLLYFCIVIGLYGMSFWMPQVIQTYGLNPLEIGFLTAIPYFFAAVAMVLWGAHSDRTGERIWHVALPLFLAGAAFAWSAAALPLALIVVALTLATVGYLCRHRHVLVAADLDPHGHGRGSRSRADQFDGQRRRTCRTSDHRRDQTGDGLVHGRAPFLAGALVLGALMRSGSDRPSGAGERVIPPLTAVMPGRPDALRSQLRPGPRGEASSVLRRSAEAANRRG